jgi:nicotinate-nucleotide--dimethylbenzimidazole phosphoribosyltransferase
MLETIRDGGAAINNFCDSAGLQLEWYNLAVDVDLVREEEKVADGTKNMLEEPAIPGSKVWEAVKFGRDVARNHFQQGTALLALGEIGIGNTTASSAIAGIILDDPVEELVGPGAGVEDEQLQRKIRVVREAIQRRDPDPEDGYEILSAVGGYEIAAQVGVILEAYHRNVPVLLDGFITGAAALVAKTFEDDIERVLLAGHTSAEPAHDRMLEALDLEPMVDLNLRLGEGSGAAVAYPLLKSAIAAYHGMHTFEDIGLEGPR